MFTGKVLRAALDKFMKGEVAAANARVQVILPNGEFYDITGVKLLENKLIGVRESHRLAITISLNNGKWERLLKNYELYHKIIDQKYHMKGLISKDVCKKLIQFYEDKKHIYRLKRVISLKKVKTIRITLVA